MARTKLRLQTPTAYNLLRIVNNDIVTLLRQRRPVEIVSIPLLERAALIVNETDLLTTIVETPGV